MFLVALGCSYRNTPVAVRERLAFDEAKLALALDEMGQRYGSEAVIVSTGLFLSATVRRAERPSQAHSSAPRTSRDCIRARS